MNDLYERLQKASVQLREMAQDRSRPLLEQARLFGKAEGVRLAMSYLDEDKNFEKLLEISIDLTKLLTQYFDREKQLDRDLRAFAAALPLRDCENLIALLNEHAERR